MAYPTWNPATWSEGYWQDGNWIPSADSAYTMHDDGGYTEGGTTGNSWITDASGQTVSATDPGVLYSKYPPAVREVLESRMDWNQKIYKLASLAGGPMAQANLIKGLYNDGFLQQMHGYNEQAFQQNWGPWIASRQAEGDDELGNSGLSMDEVQALSVMAAPFVYGTEGLVTNGQWTGPTLSTAPTASGSSVLAGAGDAFGDFGNYVGDPGDLGAVGGGEVFDPENPYKNSTEWGDADTLVGGNASTGDEFGNNFESGYDTSGGTVESNTVTGGPDTSSTIDWNNLPKTEAGAIDWEKFFSNPSLYGVAGATLLGYLGSENMSDSLNNIANQQNALQQQWMSFGQPYRDLLLQYTNDPNSFINSAGVQASVNQGTSALANALSIHGNPAGSGTALHELQNYATNNLWGQYGNERDRLAGFGGLSQYAGGATQPNSVAPAIASANANAGGYNAAGWGLYNATKQPSIFDRYGGFGKGFSGVLI